jgi:hypothetical protein
MLAACLALIASVLAQWSPIPSGDTYLYVKYAGLITSGHMPYRDFALEYPPGVIPLLVLPKLIFSYYPAGFSVLGCLAITALFYDRLKQKGHRDIVFLFIVLVPISQFVFFQLDVFAAVALYFSLRAFKTGKYALSALLLATSTLTKAYPAICLLLFLASLPSSLRRRFFLVFSTGVLAILIPFFIISPNGIWSTFTYHSGRPAEILSSSATVGYILHTVESGKLAAYSSHHSVAIVYPRVNTVLIIFETIFIVGAILILLLSEVTTIAISCAALLLLYIVTFRVGSPAFMLPALFASIVAFDEMKAAERVYFRIWLLSISAAIYLVLYNYIHIIRLEQSADFLAVARMLVTAGLLIWLLIILSKQNSNILKQRLRTLVSYVPLV